MCLLFIGSPGLYHRKFIFFKKKLGYKVIPNATVSFHQLTVLLELIYVYWFSIVLFIIALLGICFSLLIFIAFINSLNKLWNGTCENEFEKCLCIICLVFICDYFFNKVVSYYGFSTWAVLHNTAYLDP